MQKLTVLLFCLVLYGNVRANVKPANIFGNHMVLQRDLPLKIWGWADRGETVKVEFHGQQKSAKPDPSGKWQVTLDKEAAGGPFVLRIQGKNTVVFEDILVGDVWLCSGQSNMEWVLADAANAANEIATAAYPNIRHIKIPHATSLQLEKDFKAADWTLCSPATAGEFSAVAYFFARKIYQETGIPIGLVNSSWGGTHCETWTSRKALESNPEFQEMVRQMPTSSVEKEAQFWKRSAQQLADFQGLTPAKESQAGWESENWDDNNWKAIQTDKLWEEQGLADFDGVVWYRKTFMLTAEQAAQAGSLMLGTIDDSDTTFVNGVKIGSTGSWNTARKYKLPLGILKPGKNTIAVKVLDTGGGGGFYGPESALKIAFEQDSLSLAGGWKVRATQPSGAFMLDPNSQATLLFNAMIHPLIPFGIKGAIWYQGESNVSRAAQYARSFPAMIQDWRSQWQQGDFPFYFVQLASFLLPEKNTLSKSTWAELRNAQLQTLALPHTGMAVATDIGDAKDIHPRNKQDVGLRLALHALKADYSKNVVNSGPVYRSMAKNGREIELSFDYVGGGLVAKNKYGYLFGFSIAGADQVFKWAKAEIRGDKVVVYSESVPDPVAVRFGWIDNPEETNFFNAEGLPASPFRTDNWRLSTEEVRFKP